MAKLARHTSWCRGWYVWVGVFPVLQQLFRLLQQCLRVPIGAQSVSANTSIGVSEGEGTHTRCCLGFVMFRFASNRERMYSACPRHRCRWTAQSSASFSERRYKDLRKPLAIPYVPSIGAIELTMRPFGKTSLGRSLPPAREGALAAN